MPTRKINSSFTQQRETIMFFLPVYSKDDHLEDGNVFKKEIKVMYLNPQTFTLNDRKLIKPQLTKGGYIVQYWGEELGSIQASGTTGSSGIEGINILRDIYRHEQIKFRDMIDRKRADEELKNKVKIAGGSNLSDVVTALGIVDAALGGIGSRVANGVSSIMDGFRQPYEQESFETFSLPPSLASFATSIDLYHQGEIYRGFFETFQVTETAQEPGLFNYQFSFKVTRRSGERLNFMPWHRNPLSSDGTTKKATEPNIGMDITENPEATYTSVYTPGLINNANIERTELSFQGGGVVNFSDSSNSKAEGISVDKEGSQDGEEKQPLNRR